MTLLTGGNGTGKTTVLDAVRVFADRGYVFSLRDILSRSEEVDEQSVDEDGSVPRGNGLNFEALFHGRTPSIGEEFLISDGCRGSSQLRVGVSKVSEMPSDGQLPQQRHRIRQLIEFDDTVLKVSFNDFTDFLPVFSQDMEWPHRSYTAQRSRRGFTVNMWPDPVNCHSLGPGLLGNQDLDRLWSSIVLTPNEQLALDALQLASHLRIEGVAVVSDDNRFRNRRVMVKLETGQRVPLKSLGDGAVRLFSTALALANAAGGFLLIDESENGLHHSLQREFWGFVLRIAHQYNVQVLATTHSWDCVAGFAAAAREADDIEGVAVRLERDNRLERDDNGTYADRGLRANRGLRAVEYSEEELEVATRQGIEIR